MAFSNQSTRVRLLKLLQYSLATQPNTAVSLSELGRTLNISRERVRQLYQQLKAEYALPPVKKKGTGIGELNRHHQVQRAERWVLEQQVKALRERGMHNTQIQQKLGISYNQLQWTFTQLKRKGETVRRLRLPSLKTRAFEAEVRSYSEQGLNVPEIARKTERPLQTIYNVLHRLGIPFNRARRPKRRITLAFEAEVQACRAQGMTPPEIATRTGRRVQSIYRVLRRLGIPFKREKRRRKSQETLALEAEVRKYSEQGLTAPEIAKRTGRPGRTIYHVLRRLGIPRNLMGKAVYSGISPQVQALEAEVRAYSEQGLTPLEIARKIGRHRASIYSVFYRLNIPLSKRSRRSV
jgi:hypothetical protein